LRLAQILAALILGAPTLEPAAETHVVGSQLCELQILAATIEIPHFCVKSDRRFVDQPSCCLQFARQTSSKLKNRPRDRHLQQPAVLLATRDWRRPSNHLGSQLTTSASELCAMLVSATNSATVSSQ